MEFSFFLIKSRQIFALFSDWIIVEFTSNSWTFPHISFKEFSFDLIKSCQIFALFSDWIIFHDQLVPGCHRQPIF